VEVKAIAPQGVKYAEIVESDGYGLRCKAVYHSSAVMWDKTPGGNSEKVILSNFEVSSNTYR